MTSSSNMAHSLTFSPRHTTSILLLALLITTVVPWSIDGLPQGVCNTNECRTCTNACPSFQEQTHEKLDCSNKLAVARSKYISSATLDCKVDPCISRYLANACYLLPESSKPWTQSYAVKARQLDQAFQSANEKARELNSGAAHVAAKQDPSRRSYYSRVTNMLITIQVLFSNALRTRSHFHRQRDYMASLHYRHVRQHVSRLLFENGDLRARVDYWRRRNDTLSFAVRTSPLALRKARDTLYNEYKSYAADAQLIDLLKKVSLTKEEQAVFIIRLKERVRAQLDELKTFNAHIKSEHVFMEELGTEIFKMFNTMFRQMRSNRANVPCGSLALTDMVTNVIMSSTKTEKN